MYVNYMDIICYRQFAPPLLHRVLNMRRVISNVGYAGDGDVLTSTVGDVSLVCGCDRRVTRFWSTWPQDEHAVGRRRDGPLLLRPDVLWGNPALTGRFLGTVRAGPTYPFLQTLLNISVHHSDKDVAAFWTSPVKEAVPILTGIGLWLQLK